MSAKYHVVACLKNPAGQVAGQIAGQVNVSSGIIAAVINDVLVRLSLNVGEIPGLGNLEHHALIEQRP